MAHSLLLEVFDELLGFVVLLLQSLVLRLRLLQVLVDRVAERLRLDPVALQLQHPLLVLLDAGLQLALLLLPALLLPLHRRQLRADKNHFSGSLETFNGVILQRILPHDKSLSGLIYKLLSSLQLCEKAVKNCK